ncbi:MAG: hypothetical protein H0V19_09535 [Euzebyales bacterium]|nr:hypothetical protein [Euzebyales bacterium]
MTELAWVVGIWVLLSAGAAACFALGAAIGTRAAWEAGYAEGQDSGARGSGDPHSEHVARRLPARRATGS